MLLRAAVSFLAYAGTTHGFVMNVGPSNRRDASKFALAGEPDQHDTYVCPPAGMGMYVQRC